jgi:hypothetical protein
MCNGAEINLIDGFNDIKFHDTLIKNYTEMIPLVANAGFKILFALAEIKENKRRRTKQLCYWVKKIDSLCRKTWCSFSHGIVKQ